MFIYFRIKKTLLLEMIRLRKNNQLRSLNKMTSSEYIYNIYIYT